MINWVVYKQQSQFVADKKAFPCQDNDATKVDKEGKGMQLNNSNAFCSILLSSIFLSFVIPSFMETWTGKNRCVDVFASIVFI